MHLQSKKLRLATSTALVALFASIIAPAAFAGPSNVPVGLSSDGSTMLDEARPPFPGTTNYYLTDTLTGDYITIAPPAGSTNFVLNALSGDGKTAIGLYYDASGNSIATSWTADGGFVDLGPIVGGSTAIAVSADGAAITGWAEDAGAVSEAYYWTRATGMIGLGALGGTNSSGLGISADGTTVVGYADRADGSNHAFVWTASSGTMSDIDTLYVGSLAGLASSDGSVVAGQGSTAGGDYDVFRWTAADGMVDIGNLGGSTTELAAMSRDGGVLVGDGETADHYFHAYRYDASTGVITDLGTLGGQYSFASAVNADGTVVVGVATDAATTQQGFRWSKTTGMISVDQWLTAAGVRLGSDTTTTANFVSADGNVIVGTNSAGSTYVARVADVGTGIVDMSEYLPTVAAVGSAAFRDALSQTDTVMFGVQGAPMRNLLSTGQRSVWGTVDGGYDNGDGSRGGLGLGEFGFGYGVADGVTARFSAGGTYTSQDLDAVGDIRQRGFYLSPEVSANIGHNVYFTVGGYWGRSSIDSHRGYLNGADRDYSDGDTNAETWGAKIRFDWLNAVTIKDTVVTPYAGLSYARTKVDAFTEDSGSFPVSYDAADDHVTIARIGGDFVHPLTDKVRLLAKAEAAYQFESQSTSTRGTIIGISDFDLSGQDLKQFWLRGGLGGEFDVGKGTASMMVNATTQGQNPNVWLRTNFTVKF